MSVVSRTGFQVDCSVLISRINISRVATEMTTLLKFSPMKETRYAGIIGHATGWLHLCATAVAHCHSG